VKRAKGGTYSTGPLATYALCSRLSHVPAVWLDDNSVIDRQQMFHVEQSLEPKV